MKIAYYKTIYSETERVETPVPAEYDADGNILTDEHIEVHIVEKPLPAPKTVIAFRDATEEEMQTEPVTDIPVGRSTEERLDDLEAAVDILLTGVVE